MLNMLLIENDIYYSKELINKICQANSKLRLQSIAINEQESSYILNNYDIDIVILDLTVPNYIKILNEMKTKKKLSFVIFLGNNKLNIKGIEIPFIYEYIDKNFEIDSIVNKINIFTKTKEYEDKKVLIRNKINNELKHLEYNLSYFGTRYLSDAIFILYTKRKNCNNLRRDIYPIIAKKYGKTVHNIKCNIVSSTNNMYYECSEEKLKKYFNFCILEKPGPKLVMYTVLNTILKYV